MTRPSIDQQITFLYTPDLEASIYFYEEILGLPPALDQGTCRIYRVSDGGYLGVCRRDEQPATGSLIVTIATQEVDEWYHFLRDKDVTFEKPPTLNPQYNIYHCFLRDPNGYLIEIQRFLDPAWPLS
jgi:catechol 2,3-dioxygenase-like lactoylglutathione lyase family enzyme